MKVAARHADTGTGTLARAVDIEFLFLNLTTCTRCRGTNKALDEALAILRPVLEATGVRVTIRKTQVKTLAQARKLRFLSSPTIRVNGRDIALVKRESRCASCGSACDETVNCRVWVYRGREFTAAPAGLIVDAILRGIYAEQRLPKPTRFPGVPDNLKRVFAARARGAEARTC